MLGASSGVLRLNTLAQDLAPACVEMKMKWLGSDWRIFWKKCLGNGILASCAVAGRTIHGLQFNESDIIFSP